MPQRLKRALRAERIRLDVARLAHSGAKTRHDELVQQIAIHKQRVGEETARIDGIDPNVGVARAWLQLAKTQAVLLAGNLEEAEDSLEETRVWLTAQLLQVRAIERAVSTRKLAAIKASDRAAQIAQDDRNGAQAGRAG